MRGTKRVVSVISILSLLIVNLVTFGLLTSSAYEIQSGAPSTETSSGQESTDTRQPAVVTPAATSSASNSSTTKRDDTIDDGERDGSAYKYGWINGFKYEDLNGDGDHDPGEPGLEGVEFNAHFEWAWNITWDIDPQPRFSDANGSFAWEALMFNGAWCPYWTVTESQMSGYYNTTPTEVQAIVPFHAAAYVEFGNTRYVKIFGYKWNDLNKDGVWQDSVEPPLEGVTIELRDGNGTLIATTTTGPNGYYEFTGLKIDDYTVSEVVPAGFQPTTPVAVNVTGLTSGEERRVDFGNGRDLGRIFGYKWEENLSGTNQYPASSIAPLGGVTIELSQNGSVIATTTTAANGFYEFTGLAAGVYTVSEVVPGGYKAVWAVSVDVTLPAGGEQQVDFKNTRIVGSISGTKWVDSDADGDAAGENPLEGVTIELWLNGALVASTVTDAGGHYAFYGLGAGDYTVTEVVPAGMYPTWPESLSVTLAEGEDRTGVDFLNAPYGKIFGYKWDDLNGNATNDSGDDPVEGVTIELSQNGSVIATTITNAEGYYEFTGLKAGDYVVSEIVPDGWNAIWPVSVEVNELLPGEAREVDFLNDPGRLVGSISGTKWLDSDADGDAAGESPLAGVTIQLWIGTELQATTTTAADGTYLFENLPAGDYVVMEVVPTSMYPTSTTSIPVTLAEGEHRTGVDFLNAPYGTINGHKWDDTSGDGVHAEDGTEPGVKNITITLSRDGMVDQVTTTDDNGFYEFLKLEPGDYTVTETLPSGTTNTTPLSVTVTLDPGETETVDFLNTAVLENVLGSVTAIKFYDKNGNAAKDSGEALEAGVTIQVTGTKLDGSAYSESQVTGTSGEVTFANLDLGTYTVKLTKNLSGYYMTTSSQFSVTLTVADPDQTVYFGNNNTSTLPYTGINQSGWYMIAAAIMLIGLFAMLLGVFRNLAMNDK